MTPSGTATAVVDDPEAIDGKALWIQAEDEAFLSFPAANIVPTTGATVVARIKSESFTVPAGTYARQRGNISIWGPSITTDIHWGGDNGALRDYARGEWAPNLGSDPQCGEPAGPCPKYHVIRVTARDMGGSLGIVINVYFDDYPVPVLHLTNAAAVNPENVTNGPVAGTMGFGISRRSGDIHPIRIDYFVATDAGAFAPGEEVPCLGFKLEGNLSPWPRMCSEPAGRNWADADGDGDVDVADFAVWQLCYNEGLASPPPPPLAGWCACLDRRDATPDTPPPANPNRPDGVIDSQDLTEFRACAGGSNVPPACTEP
jgi:hypothetical protein